MGYSVLVVDDDAIIRHMLRMLLEMEDYVVFEAEDGVDALEKLNASLPRAMILDVMMPRMDGIRLCKLLRAQPQTATLPIIMLSGKTQMGADQEGLAAGANAYLRKPMDVAQLLQLLSQF
ncbi:MAG: response regulator [Anaerolineales bacterium]|nr:response regulator [Anaerolineales bacterium]MCA9975785.1 response regulator [Anaerolineales bacterium]